MCEHCEQSTRILENIADLSSNLKYGSEEKWELGEAITVGGPGGANSGYAKYTVRSPFDKTLGQEYSLYAASSGSGLSNIYVSPDSNVVVPGLTNSDTGTGEINNLTGILLVCPANTSIPLDEKWFAINNSNGILYVFVKTSQASYVTVQFRRKR